jgi:hypothetical protein
MELNETLPDTLTVRASMNKEHTEYLESKQAGRQATRFSSR